jgi:hypothetical protein
MDWETACALSSARVWASKRRSTVQEPSVEAPPSMILFEVNLLGVRITTGLADQDQGLASSLRWHMRANMTCNTPHYMLLLSSICRVIFSPLPHCHLQLDFDASLQGVQQGEARGERTCSPPPVKDLNGAYCAATIR